MNNNPFYILVKQKQKLGTTFTSLGFPLTDISIDFCVLETFKINSKVSLGQKCPKFDKNMHWGNKKCHF